MAKRAAKKTTKAPTKKATKRKPAASTASPARKTGAATKSRAATKPKLLSGGNPQIPKGDGPDSVRAYIEAMPRWKRDVGRELDALIERTVPGVRKAVRWNSPFYGVEGRGWFLAFHCITKYVKVTLFRGTSLDPVPPVGSKHPEVRYFHVFEDEPMDAVQVERWVRQAAKLDGEHCF
jgi:hypothetical protein